VSDAIVQATGLTKTFRRGQVEVTALQHVELAVKQGEFIALMGPSGSGKSEADEPAAQTAERECGNGAETGGVGGSAGSFSPTTFGWAGTARCDCEGDCH
jgi:ABC-type polysaccharide/polyol phosphate transport system ATPase subunit